MKTKRSFRQLAIAFLAAGAPWSSEEERRVAEMLARWLPFQYRSMVKALKVLNRDLEHGS
jgi:hypothetical protein